MQRYKKKHIILILSQIFRNFAAILMKRVMNINKKKYYIIPIAICVLALACVAVYYLGGSLSKSQQCEYVYIDSNDDLDSVSAKLSPIAQEKGLFSFRLIARHNGYAKHIKTGRYAIQPEESVISVIRKLKSGHQEPIRLTIPESKTTDRLAGALSKKLMADSLSLAILLKDSSFCKAQGYDTATIVCMFVPDTYEVYWNTSIENLMNRLRKEHDKFWSKSRQDKATAVGLTPDEVCTLASIIDEETANNAEKPMIARMYLNRLKKGMPLQADPTVKFAMKDFGLKRIYHDMLKNESPYNTYRYAGLPPGPIKVASVAGIDAVLNAANHNFLYMCAKEDFSGTHNFAATYSEHLRNAAKYAKALNEKGIK